MYTELDFIQTQYGDDALLAVGDTNGCITLWDARFCCSQRHQHQRRQHGVGSDAFSSSRARLRGICSWQAHSGDCYITVLAAGRGTAGHLVTGCDDGSVRAWDVHSDGCTRLVREYNTHVSQITAAATTKTGRLVLSACLGQKLCLWDSRSERPVLQVTTPQYLLSCHFIGGDADDGHSVLACASQGLPCILDLRMARAYRESVGGGKENHRVDEDLAPAAAADAAAVNFFRGTGRVPAWQRIGAGASVATWRAAAAQIFCKTNSAALKEAVPTCVVRTLRGPTPLADGCTKQRWCPRRRIYRRGFAGHHLCCRQPLGMRLTSRQNFNGRGGGGGLGGGGEGGNAVETNAEQHQQHQQQQQQSQSRTQEQLQDAEGISSSSSLPPHAEQLYGAVPLRNGLMAASASAQCIKLWDLLGGRGLYTLRLDENDITSSDSRDGSSNRSTPVIVDGHSDGTGGGGGGGGGRLLPTVSYEQNGGIAGARSSAADSYHSSVVVKKAELCHAPCVMPRGDLVACGTSKGTIALWPTTPSRDQLDAEGLFCSPIAHIECDSMTPMGGAIAVNGQGTYLASIDKSGYIWVAGANS